MSRYLTDSLLQLIHPRNSVAADKIVGGWALKHQSKNAMDGCNFFRIQHHAFKVHTKSSSASWGLKERMSHDRFNNTSVTYHFL